MNAMTRLRIVLVFEYIYEFEAFVVIGTMCRGIVALSAKRHGARILASTSAFRRYVQLPFSARLLGGRHGRIVLHTFECFSKCFVRYIVRTIF